MEKDWEIKQIQQAVQCSYPTSINTDHVEAKMKSMGKKNPSKHQKPTKKTTLYSSLSFYYWIYLVS